MAKRVLVSTAERPHLIVEPGEEFAVTPPFRWVSVSDAVTRAWRWNGHALLPPPPEIPNPSDELREMRALAIEALLESQRGNPDAPGAVRDYLERKP